MLKIENLNASKAKVACKKQPTCLPMFFASALLNIFQKLALGYCLEDVNDEWLAYQSSTDRVHLSKTVILSSTFYGSKT